MLRYQNRQEAIEAGPVRGVVYVGKNTFSWRTCPTCKEYTVFYTNHETCSNRCARLLGVDLHDQTVYPDLDYKSTKYRTFHKRVVTAFGKASKCTYGCVGRAKYEWANLTGKYGDIDDYIEMCTPCHNEFDKHERRVKVET